MSIPTLDEVREARMQTRRTWLALVKNHTATAKMNHDLACRHYTEVLDRLDQEAIPARPPYPFENQICLGRTADGYMLVASGQIGGGDGPPAYAHYRIEDVVEAKVTRTTVMLCVNRDAAQRWRAVVQGAIANEP